MFRFVLLSIVFAATTAFSAAGPERIGTWTIERNQDPKTGTVITSANVLGKSMRIDYGCNAGRGAPTMLVVTSTTFLGGVNGAAFRPATFSADPGHPVSVKLRYDYNTVSAQYDDTLRAVKAAMAGGRSLVVRLLTQLGDPVDASFDITGADSALALVDRACNSMPAPRS